jgi:hypothetical protein
MLIAAPGRARHNQIKAARSGPFHVVSELARMEPVQHRQR